jgi:hypothetical protein
MDTTEVTYAVAQILADAGAGVWRPTGPAYTAAEVAIAYGPLPASPDRAIGVTVYTQTDDPMTGLADRYVQVRSRGSRGAPNGADIVADAAFAALHNTYRTRGLARVTRTSTAPLGADENGRQERTDNYRIVLDN